MVSWRLERRAQTTTEARRSRWPKTSQSSGSITSGGGAAGAALANRCFDLGWTRRMKNSRAVIVTESGKRGFSETSTFFIEGGFANLICREDRVCMDSLLEGGGFELPVPPSRRGRSEMRHMEVSRRLDSDSEAAGWRSAG